MRLARGGALLLVASALAGPAVARGPSAGDVRNVAARWLDEYDRIVSELVAVETCTQRVFRQNPKGEATVTRVLQSEFAWVPVLGGRDVLGIRDVRQVDGQEVGDPGHLEALLRAPVEERDSKVAALLGESVRLLEVPTAVNFNFPTFALGYLRPANAERARWSVKDRSPAGTVTLRFREGDRSLVRTPEGRPVKAEGWLRVDTASGKVVEASVTLNDAHAVDVPSPGTESVHYEARVRFAEDARVGAWVPTVMEDRYEWRRRSAESGSITNALLIDGRSTYTEFRRYSTDARIVPR